MKPLLILLGSFLLAVSSHAQSPVFVKMLRDVSWPDNTITLKDSVELVLGQTGTEYIVASLNGAKFPMPKSAGVLIPLEEAALILLAERDDCTTRASELLAEGRSASQPGSAVDQSPSYDPAAAARRYQERKLAREKKIRENAAASAAWQQQQALQGLNREVRELRKELNR